MNKIGKKIRRILEIQAVELPHVLIVGDLMLDKYYYGDVQRISPEAPVPVTRVMSEKDTLGGAANVAHNVAALGFTADLVGVVGVDHHKERLLGLLKKRNICCSGICTVPGPTTTKVRIIGGHQQMLRLDFEDTAPIEQDVENTLFAYVERQVATGKVGAMILSDYAKGVCTENLCQQLIRLGQQKGIPVIVDPKGSDWRKYRGAAIITPNLKELNEAVHQTVKNEDEPIRLAAHKIRRKYQVRQLLVTRSERGMSLVGAKRSLHIPTHAQEVFDVSGAGDTVIAVLSAFIAAGMKAEEAAQTANIAAGVVVGKLGTYAISRSELLVAAGSL